ncbi:HAD-superfamily subfamily IB hydrolase, TIGR01490 [Corynebacterium mustelae]|uniref:HAD-superfamily subfamily IB hydrolase, TIGR01490 n=1 Tax=Corynebacterium mustelae TaxID=571915 RepID=A0A0G3H0U4_9CORY|nr:HAD-IB family hydrolase [Corynebacterium mustelae]AKK04682.1 HAD-superfamily subfamily IB hydrolase, TIGR01490 [Corynebacterium mustelae]
MSEREPTWHERPEDFLASWSSTRGNLRRFFEERALPPIDDSTQQKAGEAAAAMAASELFGLDLKDFTSGLDSVSGSYEAADSTHLHIPTSDIPGSGAAAFFDVDNTLIQGSSLIVFALGLARRRYISLGDIIPVAWKQLKFRVTGAENAEDVAEGREQALEFIKGRSVAELVDLCEEIVDTHMRDKLWPGTKQLADKHIAAGDQVWLVSATPVQLGQILAKRLGFTGALGTVAEVKDGLFTGRLVGDILHGPGKRHAVAALATMEKLDLSRCTAYSDSINDTPMLSMVGTAVAINPDRQLSKEAKRRGWEIHDYRSLRKAIRTFGVPALATAVFSWKAFRRSPNESA